VAVGVADSDEMAAGFAATGAGVSAGEAAGGLRADTTGAGAGADRAAEAVEATGAAPRNPPLAAAAYDRGALLIVGCCFALEALPALTSKECSVFTGAALGCADALAVLGACFVLGAACEGRTPALALPPALMPSDLSHTQSNWSTMTNFSRSVICWSFQRSPN
jgi:hypothetical protein